MFEILMLRSERNQQSTYGQSPGKVRIIKGGAQKVPFSGANIRDGTDFPGGRGFLPGKRKGHKLKKILRTPARCRHQGHPAGQTAVSRPVSQGFSAVCYRETDRKEQFCWDTGRVCVPWFRSFSEILCNFVLMFLFCSVFWPGIPQRDSLMLNRIAGL